MEGDIAINMLILGEGASVRRPKKSELLVGFAALIFMLGGTAGCSGEGSKKPDKADSAKGSSKGAGPSGSEVAADPCNLLSPQVTNDIVGISRGTADQPDKGSTDSVCQWVNAAPRDPKMGRLTVNVRNRYEPSVTPQSLYSSFEGTSCNEKISVAGGKACWRSDGALMQIYFVRNRAFGWVLYDAYPAGGVVGARRTFVANRLANDVLGRL